MELQDLSQPKSEASLPEGFLAVPLLRHQVWFGSTLNFRMLMYLLVILYILLEQHFWTANSFVVDGAKGNRQLTLLWRDSR